MPKNTKPSAKSGVPMDESLPSGSLSVADHLAMRRTHMANERTLLSFVRTFLGLVTAGVAMLQILTQQWMHALGYAFLVLGPVILVVGLVQYFRTRRMIHEQGYREED